MRTNLIAVAALSALSLTMVSCASLFTKSKQDIMFKGVPGTTITDQSKSKVLGEIGTNGFVTVPMKKQLKGKDIRATKEGYKTKDYHMDTKIQGWFWGNLVFGGVPGMVIDVATGKMKKYKDTVIDLTLLPIPGYGEEEEIVIPPALPKEQEAVGQDVNDIIVRWFFDSDPRGARVFYRVISSVPDEVKNTNEIYLTTTPIEETKSFNIKGLTYENSRDVTIEIKITKRGYEDQVKRFNVRQALDQQEISGFFELIPKE